MIRRMSSSNNNISYNTISRSCSGEIECLPDKTRLVTIPLIDEVIPDTISRIIPNPV